MISETRERERALATLRGSSGVDVFNRAIVPGDLAVNMSYKRCGIMVVTKSSPDLIHGVQVRVTRAGHVRRTNIQVNNYHYRSVLLVNENLSSQLPRVQEVIDEIRNSL